MAKAKAKATTAPDVTNVVEDEALVVDEVIEITEAQSIAAAKAFLEGNGYKVTLDVDDDAIAKAKRIGEKALNKGG